MTRLFTEVSDVEECVKDGEQKDGPSGHLVEMDVLITGQQVTYGGAAQARHRPPQDQ